MHFYITETPVVLVHNISIFSAPEKSTRKRKRDEVHPRKLTPSRSAASLFHL